MRLLGADMPHREPQGESSIEPRVRQKHLAGVVDGLQDALIEGINLLVGPRGTRRAGAKADDAQWNGCQTLEVRNSLPSIHLAKSAARRMCSASLSLIPSAPK